MDPPDAVIVAHTVVRKAALEELRAVYHTLFTLNGVPEEYIAKSVDDATRQMGNMANNSIQLCIAGYVCPQCRATHRAALGTHRCSHHAIASTVCCTLVEIQRPTPHTYSLTRRQPVA